MSEAKTLTALQPADLDLLAQLIENEKCALILGPFASNDVGPDDHRRSLHSLLALELAEALRQKTGQAPPEPDHLALVCTAFMQHPDTPRLSLEIKVRDFYRRYTTPSPLLQEAARLPFRLIFTTSPDDLLQRAFSIEKKRSFRDGYYRFSKTQIDDYDTTPEGWAYIYQLFGRVLDKPDGSLVLTQGDQLEYIDSVQGVGKETRLPTGLRNAMQDCEAFLFLGFDYENWYLRVLFHILKFSATAKLVFGLPEGASAQMLPGTEAFFRQQYKFSFFQNDSVQLLADLRQRIESGGGDPAQTAQATRKLLFLYALPDESIKQKLDKQLSAIKRAHQLASVGIHDFVAGDDEEAKNAFVDTASVIVVLLSADFLADETLAGVLTQRALARQSASVCVAAVYAREVGGAADIFRGKAPVFPAETIPLSVMQEEAGLPMVASMLDKLIAVLQ